VLQREAVVVDELVEHVHPRARVQQPRNEHRTDVAGAPDHQHTPSGEVHFHVE
jgi:hypothetical protein